MMDKWFNLALPYTGSVVRRQTPEYSRGRVNPIESSSKGSGILQITIYIVGASSRGLRFFFFSPCIFISLVPGL